ncbi:hypothetical protein [Robertmurraya kyonggiensis]|uniref:Uncharacterized protein n=1 Tax=Robertmurraya kyonggiensis TaxID=1037680 RepID=A0A4U1D4W1_9BACI|nr:hypothetical protein [Robertmurraya kyonggiensis]TKC16783.1 hypothetical protein FA727_11995 [Robertmurraya kyonggiensis]
MLVIGLFKQSIELEQALAELENKMIPKEHVLVTFMDKKNKEQEHRVHPFEIGMCFGTAGAVIGATCGFAMTLGPIIWGLIGLIIGYWVGAGIHFLVHIRKKASPFLHEVTVIVQCSKEQFLHVRELFWEYGALSIGEHQ